MHITSMKKILAILMLASIFGAGAAISAMNAKSEMRPAKPQQARSACDICPPKWQCHINGKTGAVTCTYPLHFFDGF